MEEVTGFGPSEIAQLVPGVQAGQRVTVDTLNVRLTALENVVREVVSATFQTKAVSDTVDNRWVTKDDMEKENDRLRVKCQALEREVAALREELVEATGESEHWEREHDLIAEEYERLRCKIDDLLG